MSDIGQKNPLLMILSFAKRATRVTQKLRLNTKIFPKSFKISQKNYCARGGMAS
jgi:hypothetical protein